MLFKDCKVSANNLTVKLLPPSHPHCRLNASYTDIYPINIHSGRPDGLCRSESSYTCSNDKLTDSKINI